MSATSWIVRTWLADCFLSNLATSAIWTCRRMQRRAVHRLWKHCILTPSSLCTYLCIDTRVEVLLYCRPCTSSKPCNYTALVEPISGFTDCQSETQPPSSHQAHMMHVIKTASCSLVMRSEQETGIIKQLPSRSTDYNDAGKRSILQERARHTTAKQWPGASKLEDD